MKTTAKVSNSDTSYKPFIIADQATSKLDWLKARKNYLTASDAAAIVGLNPYKTPHAVWLDKTTDNLVDIDNDAMRWGRILEPVVAEEFALQTDLEIKQSGELIQHPEHEFLAATPDYYVWEDGRLGLLEIKTTSIWNAKSYVDGIPDSTHCQVMMQLACTGFKFAYVAVLVGGQKFSYQRIERDDALINALIDHLSAFWLNVQTKTPPVMRAGDLDWLSDTYEISNGDRIALPESAAALVDAYNNAKADEGDASERKKDAQAKLCALLGDYETARVNGYTVSWKTQMRTTIDSQALRKHYPAIAEQCSKAAPSRVFTIKEAKQ